MEELKLIHSELLRLAARVKRILDGTGPEEPQTELPELQNLQYRDAITLIRKRLQVGDTNAIRTLAQWVKTGKVMRTGQTQTAKARYTWVPGAPIEAVEPKPVVAQVQMSVPEPIQGEFAEWLEYKSMITRVSGHYGVTPEVANAYMKAWYRAGKFELQNRTETEPARYRIKQTETPEPPTI